MDIIRNLLVRIVDHLGMMEKEIRVLVEVVCKPRFYKSFAPSNSKSLLGITGTCQSGQSVEQRNGEKMDDVQDIV